MEELLRNITGIIQEYRNMEDRLVFDDVEHLSGLLKNLTSDLVFLEKYRDEQSRLYYATIYNLINGKEQMAATRAEKEAKYHHPDKRRLERFIHASNGVKDAIRTNISFLKTERN